MDEGRVRVFAALLDLHLERHEILLRARHHACADVGLEQHVVGFVVAQHDVPFALGQNHAAAVVEVEAHTLKRLLRRHARRARKGRFGCVARGHGTNRGCSGGCGIACRHGKDVVRNRSSHGSNQIGMETRRRYDRTPDIRRLLHPVGPINNDWLQLTRLTRFSGLSKGAATGI